MRQALYIENAFWQSEGTRQIRRRLSECAALQGLELVVRSNADFMRPGAFEGLPERCVFWDKDVRLALMLEKRGLRLYNGAEAIRVCDDKALTWLALSGQCIPMPDTLLCPASFEAVGYPATGFIDEAARRLGLPFIIKEAFGSFGRQVYLARSLAEARALVTERPGVPMLFQRFVAESAGQDLRVYVVGGRVIGAMRRVGAEGDFRANVAAGGHAEAWRLSGQEEALALRSCAALGLDFAGVDLLLSKEGPLLCEVNSNAHFRALEALTGGDVAGAIISHVTEGM